mgnify:FL=1
MKVLKAENKKSVLCTTSETLHAQVDEIFGSVPQELIHLG